MAGTTNRIKGELVADVTKILGRAMYLGAQDAEQDAPSKGLLELTRILGGGREWKWWTAGVVTHAYRTGRMIQLQRSI